MYVSVITQIIPVSAREVDEELKNTYFELNPDFPPRVFKGMDGIITLEEHPDILSDVRGETALNRLRIRILLNQRVDRRLQEMHLICIRYQNVQHVYHRPDCSGLKDADLLEFASSGEALEV